MANYFQNAQDWTVQEIASSGASHVVAAGQINVNYSGTGSANDQILVPTGLHTQTNQFTVRDWFGIASITGANIVVTGQSAGAVTFNGAQSFTLDSNYESATFVSTGTAAWRVAGRF